MKNFQKIYKYLLVRYDKNGNGIDCAVSGKQLSRAFKLQERELRAIVLDMIYAGYNIGSSNRLGYFLVYSLLDEKEATLPELKRIKTISRRISMTRSNRMRKMSKKLVRTK